MRQNVPAWQGFFTEIFLNMGFVYNRKYIIRLEVEE